MSDLTSRPPTTARWNAPPTAASSDSNATSRYPIRDVWDAITNPARLADWWLPFDADITVDLREGGEMVLAATGDEPMTITCTILRVEPPMLLEHTHVDPGSYMRWELEAGRHRMRAAAEPLRAPTPTTAIDNCYVVGLHTSLARLEPCLAGQPDRVGLGRLRRMRRRTTPASVSQHHRPPRKSTKVGHRRRI